MGKKYSLLSSISQSPAQSMVSDHLHVNCSAPASKSWTDAMNSSRMEGLPSPSGRWPLYPQLCSTAAEEHRVNFLHAWIQAVPFTLPGLVMNLCAQQPMQMLSPNCWGRFAGSKEGGKEQDHCHWRSQSGRGPKLCFRPELKWEVFQKTKMGREKRVPVYSCWRGQGNGLSNGNVTAQGFVAESLRTCAHWWLNGCKIA